ncbi:MAG: GatB/YqeY domain-containing protein [Cytophagales bacterium]|nr:GatB/YqeY domain-containing protein [Cytophagales bacterium]
MSALKDQITNDMKDAMRAKDTQRLGTIRLLLAACKQKEVDERVVLDDVMVIAIVDKLVKQRKDSITAYESANRQDLADVEKAELVVLQGYLPARLSSEEVAAEVAVIVASLTAELGRKPAQADMGKVMGAAKAKLAGKADMGQVSSAIKAALA